jgi:hypothetical protein
MGKETKKIEGPTCACGRGDLYDKWLKQYEAGEKEETSTPANQAYKINATKLLQRRIKSRGKNKGEALMGKYSI